MEITQVYEIVNTIASEITGQTDLVNEDLSNIVDVGTALFDATSVDKYVKALTDRVGKTLFNNRKYSGNVPSVLMDSWEFGSVVQKITAEMPDATENGSYELKDGESYDVNVFYKPSVSSKFFNKKTTFEIPLSFTERQVKSSFNSASELNGFLTMLYNSVENSLTIKIDSLIMRTINNMIAQTMYTDLGALTTAYADTTGTKAVNLLKLYNDKFSLTLTTDTALTDSGFIKFSSLIMKEYMDRMSKVSTLFNVGAKARFTPADKLHVILLSDFNAGSISYLESNTFHNDLVALPKAEIVPYWQGSGTNYSFDKTSAINVNIDLEGVSTKIETSGIIGVMFDNSALGVTNFEKRVTTNYNAKAEFYNNWYKVDCGYFNDLNENFVVFYIQDSTGD